MFCSFQSVKGKWWWLGFFYYFFNEHFKYIILLHLCRKIAQTPSLELRQICSILSEQQAVYALLNRKALVNLILYTCLYYQSLFMYLQVWGKYGCCYIINSVLLPFFLIQVVDYMVWDIFAGGIENHIYQLLHPLSNTLLNDTAPITYNSV